jgi:ferredoxin-like protein FixX
MWIRTLSTLECTKLLSSHRVGRLACAKDGQPYVVPIYYAYNENHLYAFSMPGKKIDFMRANPLVCVLVDAKGEGRGWQSVIAEGRYEELPDRIGFKRERAKDCSSCYSACDHACPMRLNPRNVKRMMFACVQCGQCVDACDHTMENNPNGSLLNWVHDLRAESEAAFNVRAARTTPVRHVANVAAKAQR